MGPQVGFGLHCLHWFWTQPVLPVHVPQLIMLPQPSSTVPQCAPRSAQVLGVQPQTPGAVPPPQVCGDVQDPQSSVLPQPSCRVPHFWPCAAQVVGVQPQTLSCPPPPQLSGAVHVPQLRVPPQLSGMLSQFFCWASQVVGVQLVAQLPALQNWPWGQGVPQEMVPLALQPSG